MASLANVPKSDRPDFVPEVGTPKQARAILAAFEETRLEPLVLVIVATGVRHGELLALRWSDVGFPGETVTICRAVDIQNGRWILARPKTARSQRTVALIPLARRALELERAYATDARQIAGAEWDENGVVFAGPTGG